MRLQAFKHLIDIGRLSPDDTDVRAYVVDGRVQLAEASNGLARRYYYWAPAYGDSADPELARFAAAAAEKARRQARSSSGGQPATHC